MADDLPAELELSPRLRMASWKAHLPVLAGACIIYLAILVGYGLFPSLGVFARPFSVPVVGAVVVVVSALLMEVLLNRHVILSAEWIGIERGPFRAGIRNMKAIRAVYAYEDGRRRYHGLLRSSGDAFTFGGELTALDFERARRWLMRFAAERGLNYIRLASREDLVRLVRTTVASNPRRR